MTSLARGRELLLITAIMFCPQSLLSEPAAEGQEIFISRNFARKPIPQWHSGYLLGYELYSAVNSAGFRLRSERNKTL